MVWEDFHDRLTSSTLSIFHLSDPPHLSSKWWKLTRLTKSICHGNHLYPPSPPPTHHRLSTNHINFTLLFLSSPFVRSECESIFDSKQSQESKFEVCTQDIYAVVHIKTPFDNALYLSSMNANKHYAAMCFKTYFLRYLAYLTLCSPPPPTPVRF